MPSDYRRFTAAICDSSAVKTAFSDLAIMKTWWRIVLWLHGKPQASEAGIEDKRQCVADGFVFYADLYRSLAWVFAALVPTLIYIAKLGSYDYLYWELACAGGFVYLWLTSSLGRWGAQQYRSGKIDGRISLAAFLVMISAFLSMLIVALSIVVHFYMAVSNCINLLTLSILLAFGVGSYLIELIYLVGSAMRPKKRGALKANAYNQHLAKKSPGDCSPGK
jgi:hypothetical protein